MITQKGAQLLISVVRRSRGETVVNIARNAGATGSTVLFGRGTAGNKWLRLLCLADVEKELVFTIAPQETMQKIEDALRAEKDLCVKMPGIGMVIEVEEFLRLGPGNNLPVYKGVQNSEKGDLMANEMDKHDKRVLICVIVNAGLADDLMAAAREAGARGGTILRARGTGKDEDISFFGISIVPEKELLMIMTETKEQETITSAIKACDCLSQPGVGVIFTLPVVNFFPLGKKANSK